MVSLCSTSRSKQAGVVYIEFLLVFPPLFVLFLCIMQFAVLRSDDLGVRHAAAFAVRSAIVVLPDDPRYYEGAPVNEIPRESGCSEGVVGKIHKLTAKFGVDSRAIPKDGKCPGGPRMAAIHFSAIMKMLPFAPNAQTLMPEFLEDTIGNLGDLGWLVGAAAYSYGATAVTFPTGPGEAKMRTSTTFEPGEEITARVTYLAHCGIPIARFLMCDSSYSLLANIDVDVLKRDSANRENASERIKAAQSGISELTEGVANRALFSLLMASGQRFSVLNADATLPLSSAPYSYQGAPRKTSKP